jgi:micrococcal nuclease
MATNVFKTELAVGVLLLASSGRAVENPYQDIYQRSVQQMGVPDSLGESIPDSTAAQLNKTILLVAAGSKTCSQRCSTTCSTSCTTTKGCSSNCKKQTDGCGGGSSRLTEPPPSPRPPARIPDAAPQGESTTRRSASNSFTGRVVEVIEGDLISLVKADATKVKIRLAGIDAPEIGQAFGDKAKKLLSEKLLDQKVTVILRGSGDRGGAAIGSVYFGVRWINSEMVEEGMAWCLKASPPELDSSDNRKVAKCEETARTGKVGLWATKDPVPPWEYRQNGGGGVANASSRSTQSKGETASIRAEEEPTQDITDRVTKLQRQFTDSTGVFRVDGTVVSFASESVLLVRKDNKQVVKVPISRLSAEDQAWLKQNEGYINQNGALVLKHLQK